MWSIVNKAIRGILAVNSFTFCFVGSVSAALLSWQIDTILSATIFVGISVDFIAEIVLGAIVGVWEVTFATTTELSGTHSCVRSNCARTGSVDAIWFCRIKVRARFDGKGSFFACANLKGSNRYVSYELTQTWRVFSVFTYCNIPTISALQSIFSRTIDGIQWLSSRILGNKCSRRWLDSDCRFWRLWSSD